MQHIICSLKGPNKPSLTWKDEGFVLFGVVIAVICAVETSFFESAPKHTATVICGDGIAVDSVWEIQGFDVEVMFFVGIQRCIIFVLADVCSVAPAQFPVLGVRYSKASIKTVERDFDGLLAGSVGVIAMNFDFCTKVAERTDGFRAVGFFDFDFGCEDVGQATVVLGS